MELEVTCTASISEHLLERLLPPSVTYQYIYDIVALYAPHHVFGKIDRCKFLQIRKEKSRIVADAE